MYTGLSIHKQKSIKLQVSLPEFTMFLYESTVSLLPSCLCAPLMAVIPSATNNYTSN